MENMKDIYIQEANELLENLERSLLVLEEDPSDKSNIEQVFRVMHTLKGNSSMFGLELISEFVHHLETIYDNIRQGKMELSKVILDITLASLDHLNLIIHDSDLNDGNNKVNHHNLLKGIIAIVEQNTDIKPNESNEQNIIKKENDSIVKEGELQTYHILFKPLAHFLHDGSNPLFYVQDLADLGKVLVIPHFKKVEKMEDFDPTTCVSYWDVIVETSKSTNEILDIFMFVEDSIELNIQSIPYVNFVQNEKLKEALKPNFYYDKPVDTKQILDIAKSLGKPVEVDHEEEKEVVISAKKSESSDASNNTSKKKEKKISTIRVTSDKLDELMNVVSELVTTQASLTMFTENSLNPDLEIISENIEKLSRRLRDISFGMTLVPIDNLFSRFQRLVRDLSSTLNKEVDFVTEGGETELDKTIIETLADPLMHIIRNSMDHGLETPEQREAKGKSRKGIVKLKAFYSGVSVFIQIIDDGKGINPAIIKEKAISKGLLAEGVEMSDKEIFDFIFHPGFSTAEQVTDVSGRGVGMDVVKRNISDLRGNIAIDSVVDKGTTLTIKLPLSLSIIDGLLVEVNKVSYIIPLSVVSKCYEVSNKKMLNNFNKLLFLDEKQVPFINLREEFGNPPIHEDGFSQIIVVSDGDYSVGLSVDFIKGEYQAVVKPIGAYYRKQDFVSGATILGDGSIALVLDTLKIIDKYVENTKIEKV
jgi:two-component system chemotaxis sensor kinase CheA